MERKIGRAVAFLPDRHGPPPRIDMALPSDRVYLSEYQKLVRKQLEFFAAEQEDMEYSVQGRKSRPQEGQVGIRCKHCCNFNIRQRGRGAVYFPATLHAVYQAAQNMATNHLHTICTKIPTEIRDGLLKLKDHKKSNACGGKQYWFDACLVLGIEETAAGLFFTSVGEQGNRL